MRFRGIWCLGCIKCECVGKSGFGEGVGRL